jgi:hypothetical protein
MTPFEITTQDGARVASNGVRSLVLLDADGKIFRRRAVKCVGTAAAHQVEWAVAELGGVRVYVDGESVIVTRRDLQP